MGSQNKNLAITRRPDGLRSSRFQFSAYVCTLFLMRWVPMLKSSMGNTFQEISLRGGNKYNSNANSCHFALSLFLRSSAAAASGQRDKDALRLLASGCVATRARCAREKTTSGYLKTLKRARDTTVMRRVALLSSRPTHQGKL